jgi:PleD family two-component response regulator
METRWILQSAFCILHLTMKLPQLVVYETDGEIAGQLRRLAGEHSWLIRESRQPEACLKLLADSRPSVLLLKLERELLEGMTLLSQMAERAPDCPVVLISDVKMEGAEQRAQLSALAFDLGARYVLFPPLQQPVIEDLVFGLMTATIRRTVGPTSDDGHA